MASRLYLKTGDRSEAGTFSSGNTEYVLTMGNAGPELRRDDDAFPLLGPYGLLTKGGGNYQIAMELLDALPENDPIRQEIITRLADVFEHKIEI